MTECEDLLLSTRYKIKKIIAKLLLWAFACHACGGEGVLTIWRTSPRPSHSTFECPVCRGSGHATNRQLREHRRRVQQSNMRYVYNAPFSAQFNHGCHISTSEETDAPN